MSHWTEELFVKHAAHYAADLEASSGAASQQVADLLDLLAADHDLVPDDVLDVACGVGRHAVPLAESGLDVTALDISPEFLSRAREFAADAGVAARTQFVEADMRDLRAADLRDEYDLVTSFFTSFGYYDDEINREVLAAMADRVRPGGALVLEVANPGGLGTTIGDSDVFEYDDYFVVVEREYDPTSSRLETTRRAFEECGDDYDFVGEVTYSVRLYAPVELTNAFTEIGLDASLYGGFDGSDLERDSARYLVVGRA